MKKVENFKTKYVPHSCTETRDPPDSFWKQKRSQSFTIGKSNRVSEPLTSYYSTSTSYKPQRSHACTSPTYSRYTSSHAPNVLNVQSYSKPTKDNQYSSSFTSTRKARYDEELGNVERTKFVEEELGNFMEDNAEEYGEEDATEDDREGTGEILNKDYEEQEADDEIEEESDVCPQAQRAQRGGRSGTILKPQGWRSMERPETRRLCCQQHMSLMQNHQSSPRYYHNVAEHEIPEPLSEIDFVRTPTKSPTRRQSSEYRQWLASRNDVERYDDMPSSIQTNRRARTKPDLDRLIEAELSRTRRCNRCGNLSIRKNEISGKNGCRLEGRANIPSKGPIDDEPEGHEQAFCGRCNPRNGAREIGIPVDVAAPLYPSKSRRSRDAKSSTIYQIPEQNLVDKLVNDYSRSSSRYTTKVVEAFTEKPKRSLHTSHATARIPCRYLE